jgi:asparagine synthase (glutamine-hydrolysing)
MAGIAGIAGGKKQKETVECMLESIRHRGPDTARMHISRNCSVGVCASQLSETRGQGFAQDKDLTVLFDGEIYNPRARGVSDAEVALSLFREYGRTFASHLQGVFACAVCNGDRIILARDPVGVRPMYWGTTADGEFCFASEAKALVGVAEDVSELPPSTTYSVSTGLAGYIPDYPPVEMEDDLEDAKETLRDVLTRAVARRLEDGAVGACLLSGGLDSSVIAAVAHDLGAEIPLITVGMKDAPDLENASIMAKHLGMEHHVKLYETADICESLPNAVWMLESFEEDCVSGAISNLFASARANKLTNCILSGEGGDELFGGYHLLKDLPGETERLRMMDRLIAIAYNTAVQRLDRAMMGNSINYRTPFIDTDVIAFAMQIPVQWKIHDAGGGRWIEKYILREAFRDLLPEQIYKREKLRFAAGTGTDGIMDEIARNEVKDAKSMITAEGYSLNSAKERWYYEIFKERFPAPCFERLVGRWDPNK